MRDPGNEVGTYVPLLNRLIQDHSDYDASKEPKIESLSTVDSSVPLMHYDLSDLGLICLLMKSKISF